ncbi:MAG: YqeG family HAD IIIA-type phosphatase [Bacillota bacterium]
MLKKLTPDLYVKSIYHIDLDDLQRRGIRAIITDLDNTLVAWDDPLPNQRLIAWLKGAQAKGFSVYIVSNNSRDRVQKFARAFGVPAISKAIKPRRGAFRTACEAMGVEPKEAAIVGDQVFTDVLGGNRLGAYTILVVPVSDREFFGTKIMRMLERLVLRRLKAWGVTDSPDEE